MSEVRLGLAIQHAAFAPERTAMLRRLFFGLGGSETIRRETVCFALVKDDNRAGVWPTARRCWLAGVGSSVTHYLVLQDDAIPCPDFLKVAKITAELVPNHPISYFDMSKTIPDALALGLHWAVRGSLSSAVAVLMPIALATEGLKWIGQHVRPDYIHDDYRWSYFFQSQGIDVWYTAPSLVEHGGLGHSLLGNPDKLPSNTQAGGKWRVASSIIPKDVSALSIDWTKGLDRPHRGASLSKRVYDQMRL